ncbi:MAG: PEP-CTERM sorting domain-containing protein [Crocosphaera sp.]|nr:PEP-CTERM sorting domain-containing protein [Crocosphaera sp.]
MTKLLQNLALAGVASVATVLSASSAQAVVLFNGTIGAWEDAGSIQAGDKLFTFGASDLNRGDSLVIETAGIDNLDYLLNVNLIATETTVSSFFLDYTVEVTQPGYQIVAVDLDSTVDVFAPDEVLTTTYNTTTLTSIGGSPELEQLIPPSTFVEVSNSYFAPPGGEISAFENSFQQVPEPLTILGAGTAIAFGTHFKRKSGKANKK